MTMRGRDAAGEGVRGGGGLGGGLGGRGRGRGGRGGPGGGWAGGGGRGGQRHGARGGPAAVGCRWCPRARRGVRWGLRALRDGLYENGALMDDARRRVEQIMRRIGGAVDKPHIADFVEDYAVFQLQELDGPGGPLDAAAVLAGQGRTLARILR